MAVQYFLVIILVSNILLRSVVKFAIKWVGRSRYFTPKFGAKINYKSIAVALQPDTLTRDRGLEVVPGRGIDTTFRKWNVDAMFVRGGALSRLVRSAGGRMTWHDESYYSHFASPGTATNLHGSHLMIIPGRVAQSGKEVTHANDISAKIDRSVLKNDRNAIFFFCN